MAEQDLDAKVEELLNGGEPEPAEESPAQPEPTPAELALAELDAVVPDDPDIDEGFRGKPVRDILRVAKQHKYEAGLAARSNQERNQLEARAQAAELALQYLRQQQAAPQQPAPQPAALESNDEYIQRLAAQPREVLAEEFDQRLRPVVQELEQTRAMLVRTQADNAQIVARDSLGIHPQVWAEIQGPVANFMAYQRWPIENPQAWAEAARLYVDNAMRTAQRFTPQPAPTTPAPEVPRQGAPPNGSARSQSRPGGTKLRAGLRNELASIAKLMELDEKHSAELERYAADNLGGISG